MLRSHYLYPYLHFQSTTRRVENSSSLTNLPSQILTRMTPRDSSSVNLHFPLDVVESRDTNLN